VWKPCFACPECHGALTTQPEKHACAHCERDYPHYDEVFRFLTSDRLQAAERFTAQYRVVRDRDGYRNPSATYYRMLPLVAASDPHAGEWRIRRESFGTLERQVLGRLAASAARVLDLGAGNCWLSNRLAALGVRPVAVDRLDDDVDGLRACRHYRVPFAVVQADFDALPFPADSFDAIIFNASLHYAPDPVRSLGEARRVLAPGGVVAVMDSPIFTNVEDGEQMLEEQRDRFRTEYGIAEPVAGGVGYLTHERLAFALKSAGMRGTFAPSPGPAAWRLRRRLSALRLGRQLASFGVTVAQ
jgi:SAM-dependent methyltransferase